MGTFVHLMAARTENRAAFVDAIAGALAEQRFSMYSVPTPRADNHVRIYDARQGWTCVDFEWGTWDDDPALSRISSDVKCPVAFFRIYDGDYWCFHLYDSGRLVGKFSSRLNYWEEPWDPKEWNGNAAEVQKCLGIQEPQLANYFVHLTGDEETERKANPADEHPLEDPWVVTDFMKRLGVLYPDDVDNPAEVRYLKELRKS